MKSLLVKSILPIIVVSGLLMIGLIAVIKTIEEAHDDQYFWE